MFPWNWRIWWRVWFLLFWWCCLFPFSTILIIFLSWQNRRKGLSEVDCKNANMNKKILSDFYSSFYETYVVKIENKVRNRNHRVRKPLENNFHGNRSKKNYHFIKPTQKIFFEFLFFSNSRKINKLCDYGCKWAIFVVKIM